jgi:propionate CoA-transferase
MKQVNTPLNGILKPEKVVTAEEAILVIRDGDTVATGGFVCCVFPEEIAIALESYYIKTGKPKGLTLFYAAGQGNKLDKGLNHFAPEGLVNRVIGGHWALVPKLQKLAVEDKIIAYNLPQGVISQMFRDIAAHKPRTITKVGLGTFVDPRIDGGKLNKSTTQDIVELVHFDGNEYLAYKTMPINIAIIRGTTADLDGNITMEKEALLVDNLAVAMAARNSGGRVIAQVERLAQRGTLDSRQVKIPAILVDYIVVAKPENHCQTFAVAYNPAFSGEVKIPAQNIEALPMDERKIIARRGALELKPNSIINLGIGVPEGVASVANEEGILDYLTMSVEPGIIGGIPAGGLNFGASTNFTCLIDQPSQFDFYDGGGLDTAYLGIAQVDREGNLNVSKFGPRVAGAGGFINISQNAKKVVFVGTFMAGALKISVENGKLMIITEGTNKKFVDKVEHITFSGKNSLINNQTVLYVTERCVFKLSKKGMELIEIAPGIDLEKDILSLMDFKPIIKKTPVLMDERIFRNEPMGIKNDPSSVFGQ